MKESGQRRPPSFARQGLLILLPVVVLAVIGLVSLRQDKLLAQREAAERAQGIADEFADALWEELAPLSDDGVWPTFTVDNAGELVEPPPAALVPTPQPHELSTLSPEQLGLWRELTTETLVEVDARSLSNRIAAAQAFLGGNPPERLAAFAQFQLGLSLAQSGDAAAARETLLQLAQQFSNATGESGLPLAPLALLKSMELVPDTSAARIAEAGTLAQLVVTNPSPMTPMILERLATLAGTTGIVASSQQQWQRDNLSRELFTAARRQLVSSRPRLFWFTNAASLHATNFSRTTPMAGPAWMSNEEPWLAGRFESGANAIRFACRNHLSQRLAEVLAPAAGDDSATVVATLWAVGASATNALPQLSLYSATAPSPPLRALGKLVARLPGYLGISVDVAGQPLISSNHLPVIGLVGGTAKGGGLHYVSQRAGAAPELLASARKFDDGVEYLRVGVHLVSPDMLFSRQKARIALFGLLIVTSVIAAVVGFVSARRAFLRQQALSDMKSNFVSSVSHELRAPIASVRLMAESLERGKVAEPAKQNEYFRFITQECRRLSSLIENVLDFARIEQGRKQYDFEPTDLKALIQQTLKLMEPAAAEKQVKLDPALPEPSPFANHDSPAVDGSALQQALINLIDNAIKHSPVGGSVTVGLEQAVPSAPSTEQPETSTARPPTLEIWVEDHGPGIPPSEHERIFERFYRPGSEMRRETQGVGIGLSIVKHIIEAHGGRVRVESQVGKGSRFVIELPLDTGEAQRPRRKTS